jgi:hypothetical protein
MNDMNILSIHTNIIKEMTSRMNKLTDLKKRMEDLKLVNQKNSVIQVNIVRELGELEKLVDNIENNTEMNFYLLMITPILDAYKKELSKPIRMNFMGEDIKPDETVKKELETKFISIAKQHVTNLTEFINVDVTKCSNCKEKSLENTTSNLYVCTNCGINQEVPQVMFSYKDNDRINITTKYTYDRRIHFRDCINQFQGKQHSTISPEVYEKVYEQLRLHNLESDGETKIEKYRLVTKRHITTFLKETGNSKHYEDLNLIYHTITGQKLDNISHIEDALLQDFDTLNDLYDQMYIKTKIIDRKNFINTQYVLFQLLKRHKYPCNRSDFNFLKTNERKCFHDTICSELFQKLGWNFHSVF